DAGLPGQHLAQGADHGVGRVVGQPAVGRGGVAVGGRLVGRQVGGGRGQALGGGADGGAQVTLGGVLGVVDVGLVDDAVATEEGSGHALLLELGGELGRRRVLAAVEDEVGVQGLDVGDIAGVVGD